MQELKNCPFCGSKAVIIDFGHEYPDRPVEYAVTCPQGRHCEIGYFQSAEEAIEAWNTRHILTAMEPAPSTSTEQVQPATKLNLSADASGEGGLMAPAAWLVRCQVTAKNNDDYLYGEQRRAERQKKALEENGWKEVAILPLYLETDSADQQSKLKAVREALDKLVQGNAAGNPGGYVFTRETNRQTALKALATLDTLIEQGGD